METHFGDGLSAPEPKGAHGGWIVGAVVLLGAILGWGYLDQNHYFYHVKMAHISSGSWGGEAKECLSWNLKKDAELGLECDRGHSEVKMDVPVRFYGDTVRPLDPETVRLKWMCRRDGSGVGEIRCRISE